MIEIHSTYENVSTKPVSYIQFHKKKGFLQYKIIWMVEKLCIKSNADSDV